MLKSVESVDAAAAGSGAAVSLELASRFRLLAGLSRQQQQGRPALQQRLAGICAQHKHGGAPHACTTECRVRIIHRAKWSSGVSHTAGSCATEQKSASGHSVATRPQGRHCGTPQHIDSRTRTQTCTARARCMVWRGTCWVSHRTGTRATRQNSASWHSVATRPPGKDWHPA